MWYNFYCEKITCGNMETYAAPQALFTFEEKEEE